MKKLKSLPFLSMMCYWILTGSLIPVVSFAQSGKDGAKVISTTLSVNEYTTLTVNANPGNTSLSVANSALNSGLFPAPLAQGDLVFIIQIQGASITSPDDSTYGALISYNNCGNYEFAEVVSVPNPTTINLFCPLQKSYLSSGKTEVIRVPRYSTLTINGTGTLTCPAWNGSVGGVMVVEVLGNTLINPVGKIDVSGKGFRGGALLENDAGYGVLNFRSALTAYGAEKGEGIAGYETEYDLMSGRYGKGAPANGGGGANAHNGGGGGGANAGNLSGWNGAGNPDISNASWITAWNLEYPGFATSSSTGGGKGGYTFSSANMNALTVGPFNSSWGGDFHRDNGGRGGRPLDYSTGKIFLGGGGGAGDQNDNHGGGGSAGGGIIYFSSHGDITGAGLIYANGLNGLNTLTTNGNDGAGGGGAGGAILLDVQGVVTGISITANGGNGGTQSLALFTVEAEGPGGGGGGGYISLSNGVVTRTAWGGNNGTTNSYSLTEFPPNGATRGGTGLPNEVLSNYKINASPVVHCGPGSVTLSVTTQGTVPPGTIFYWYDQPIGGNLLATGNTFSTPVISTNTLYYVTACPGYYRVAIPVIIDIISTSFTATTVCAQAPTIFTASGTTSFGVITGWSWNFGDGTGTSLIRNPSYTYASAGTYQVVLTATDVNGCTSTASQNVIVQPYPLINFSAPVLTGCGSLTVNFTNSTSNANSYSWNFGDGTPASSLTAPSHIYSSTGTYTVTLTASGSAGCTSTSVINNMINIYPRPLASFSSATTICLGDTIHFSNLSIGNGGTLTGYSWNFGDGTPGSTQANPFHIYSTFGSFPVTLTASTANCNDDTIITMHVNPSPVVAFSASTTTGCGSVTTNFVNTTTGTPTYSWNFGDGSPVSSLISPSHTYTTPGNYSVTLIAIQGSCGDTISHQNMITVFPKPTASFSSNNQICLGDTVYFSNSSAGNGGTITSYSWNFGDGTGPSLLANPRHRYITAGNYNVTLTANTANCNDDTIIIIHVNPSPVVAFSAATTTGCGSVTTNFVNTTTGTPTYSWNFGDGTPLSSLIAPSHTYTNPGNYSVTLIAIQGSCGDTISHQNMITVFPKPTASFSSNNQICLGDTVYFSNFSAGNGATITSYSWNFGDGTGPSSLANPRHRYIIAGNYNVTLTTNTANCNDDTTITIFVNPSPVVNFSSSVITGCQPLPVTFTNATTGSPTYAWNFGDGTTSSASAPTHTYSQSGTYSVSLVATQGTCIDTLLIQNMISVYTQPTSAFISNNNICSGDTIFFTDNSSGNGGPINSYSWNFGDGTPANSQASPFHIYGTAGSFQAILTVSSGTCSDDTTVTLTVNPAPNASFQPSMPVSGCGSMLVSFTNTSSPAGTSQWNFGDGTIMTTNNPTHTYTSPGVYTISLVENIGTCSDSTFSANLVTVYPKPTSSFNTNNICLGDSAIFANTSFITSGSITGYLWDFGDGSPVSTNPDPRHLYSIAGTYNVHLVATTPNCSDDTTIAISVNPSPQVNFSSSASSGCGTLTVAFSNSTTGSPAYSWNFGDGSPASSQFAPSHTYSSSGSYSVTLIAIQGSCVDTLTIPSMIHVLPVPGAGFSLTSACLGDSVHFTDTTISNGTQIATYSWSFGDTTTLSALQNPAHLYNYAGTHPVQLVISATNGCTDTAQSNVTVLPTPTVNFITNQVSGCDSATIVFTNTSSGAVSYNWIFGDGNTSSQVSPSHVYSSPGTYTVILSATATGGCSAYRSLVNLINIHASPVVSFSSTGTSICQGDCIGFTDHSTGGVVSWLWSFPGANPTSASNSAPAQVCYPAQGSYNVSLTVSTGNCSSSQIQNALIHVVNCSSIPTANFISSDTGMCKSSCISFVDLSINATSWQWFFPGATPPTSNLENPANICFSTAGDYTVTLVASNAAGDDTLQLPNFIHVWPLPPVPTFTQSGDTLICSSAASYQWLLNGIPISGANNQRYVAFLSGNYSVTTGDANGCTSSSVLKYVSLVGIENPTDETMVYLYPNPVLDQVNLMIQSAHTGEVIIHITDALGREIFFRKFKMESSNQSFLFDMRIFASGMYWMTIDFNGRKIIRKLVKI